jgi:hypothetical protein
MRQCFSSLFTLFRVTQVLGVDIGVGLGATTNKT